MGNLWLKIKVGTKITIFVILSIATLLFVVNNINKPITVWLWNDYQTTLLKVLLITVLVSVIFTLLLATALRTVRQIREIRARSRSEWLEEEIRDMKSKASMLQTKPAGGAGNGTSTASFTVSADPTPIEPSKPAEP